MDDDEEEEEGEESESSWRGTGMVSWSEGKVVVSRLRKRPGRCSES